MPRRTASTRRTPGSCTRWCAPASRTCRCTSTTSRRGPPGWTYSILPNLGALSDTQAGTIRRFVQQGGAVVATGRTGLYDEWGDPRRDFALGDLFACRHDGPVPALGEAPPKPAAEAGAGAFAPPPAGHTYLRLSPERRGRVDGPAAGDEPTGGDRHPVLRGFDDTDLLPFGGVLTAVRAEAGAVVPLTLVPAFPTYPPETAWMREPKTDVPGLILSRHGAARIAYLPADIDRRYEKEHLPDHGALLANIVRWAAGPHVPLTVEGPGLLDCHLYAQTGRLVLHLVNLTSEATWRAPLDELIRVGPFTVRIRLPEGWRRPTARLLVAGGARPVRVEDGMAIVHIDGILDHEVLVVAS